MSLIPLRDRDFWADPFGELERLQEEMNKLFDFSLSRVFGRGRRALGGSWSPAVDIYDSKDAILVKAEIPGMKKEDIDVSIQADTLIIKGEKKHEEEKKDKNFICNERYYGAFYRAIPLGTEVNVEKVSAKYKDGVLELTIPKKEEAKPKQIKIDVK